MTISIGIDYASVDGNAAPEWAKAKAAGLTFAIVRAAYGTYPDKAFARDWTSIKAVGLTRGCYLFPQYPKPAHPAPEPELQAESLIDIVGQQASGDLPIAIDVEFDVNVQSETGLRPSEMIAWIGRIVTVLEDHYGYPPMIYTSARVFSEPLHGVAAPELANCVPWIKSGYIVPARSTAILDPALHEPPVPSPFAGAWAIQQYQGDALRFPGFTSTVDLNRFHVLAQGATGGSVSFVQRRLGHVATGVFDDVMGDKIRLFQGSEGLIADGIIGPKTFARICRYSGVEKPILA